MRKPALFLAAIALTAIPAFARETYKTVEKTLPLSPDGRVSVETYKGSVTVKAWDRAEVAVTARIEPDLFCGTGARGVAATEVRIEATSSSVRLRTDYDRVRTRHSGLGSWFSGECTALPLVHYTLFVPRGASLAVRDHKSRIELDGATGDIEVDTYKGTVRIRGAEGAVDLKTHKGEADIELARVTKDVRLETYKGDVQLSVPKGSAFSIEARLSRRAGFSSDFEFAERTRETRHGERRISGPVNGGGPTVELRTYKGDFRLRRR